MVGHELIIILSSSYFHLKARLDCLCHSLEKNEDLESIPESRGQTWKSVRTTRRFDFRYTCNREEKPRYWAEKWSVEEQVLGKGLQGETMQGRFTRSRARVCVALKLLWCSSLLFWVDQAEICLCGVVVCWTRFVEEQLKR